MEELTRRGMKVERQLQVPIDYKGKRLATPLRLDLKVNGLVLVDNKAVTEWNPIFEAQMLTYLRLDEIEIGIGHQLWRTIREKWNPPRGEWSVKLCAFEPLRLCVKFLKT